MKAKQASVLIVLSFVLNVVLISYIFMKSRTSVAQLRDTDNFLDVPAILTTDKIGYNAEVISTKKDTHSDLKLPSTKFKLPLGTVYNWNGQSWQENKTVCEKLPRFRQGTLRTHYGSTPIFIHEPADDKWISQNIIASGSWESEVALAVGTALESDNDLAFLDIGANIGVISLEAAKLGRRVISVEPLIDNVQRLCASFEEGHYPRKHTIIFNAISDTHEKVSLGRDQDNVGGTFVLKNNPNKKNGSDVTLVGEYKELVNTILLDDLLTLLASDPVTKVVIKLDVEGYEDHVLKGADDFFNQVDVHVVIMEWTYSKNPGTAETIQSFMSNHKMFPHDLHRHTLDSLPRTKWPRNVVWLKF